MKKQYKLIYIVAIFLFAYIAFLYSKGKIFPHSPHFEMDMKCKKCHANIENSKKADDSNLPGEKSCIGECHEKDIFKGLSFVESEPVYRLIYSHEIHIMQDIKCVKCHKGLGKKPYKPGSSFPKMAVCFECHDGKSAEKTCTLCHAEKVPFPHKTHIDNGTDCNDCHTKIKESTSTDNGKDIPGKASCDDCHEKKHRYSEVTRFPYKQAYLFNHKLHIEDQGLGCKECHEVLYKKSVFKQSEVTAKMEYCFECHDNSTASKHCMLCHVNPTMPDDHQNDWSNSHKIKANNNLKECKDCHTEKGFCSKCHRGINKPLNSHSSNFELTHKFEARTRMRNCKACHSTRQCRICHISKGVSTQNPVYQKRHPAGWNNPQSPNFHKRKARLRLTACTACHAKNDCSYCHITRRR